MASTASLNHNDQPAPTGVVIDPAVTVWLLMAAAGAWQIGASVMIRGWFVGALVIAAIGLAFAASRRTS